ncbi:hypothetical protein D3C87_1537440 [compost metagenome]
MVHLYIYRLLDQEKIVENLYKQPIGKVHLIHLMDRNKQRHCKFGALPRYKNRSHFRVIKWSHFDFLWTAINHPRIFFLISDHISVQQEKSGLGTKWQCIGLHQHADKVGRA